MSSEGTPHSRHHLQLPTGDHVEVVYHDRGESPGELHLSVPASGRPPGGSSHTRLAARPSSRVLDPTFVGQTEPLHVCFHCLGDLVYAVDWTMEGRADWRVLLRCPDCGATREGVFDKPAVECLNDELDRALVSILDDLRLLTAANMQEEIDYFARALRDDLIGPGDFAQR